MSAIETLIELANKTLANPDTPDPEVLLLVARLHKEVSTVANSVETRIHAAYSVKLMLESLQEPIDDPDSDDDDSEE